MLEQIEKKDTSHFAHIRDEIGAYQMKRKLKEKKALAHKQLTGRKERHSCTVDIMKKKETLGRYYWPPCMHRDHMQCSGKEDSVL